MAITVQKILKDTVSTAEAAEHLGVSVERIRQLIANERLPAVKIQNCWRINRSAMKRVEDRSTGRPKRKFRKSEENSKAAIAANLKHKREKLVAEIEVDGSALKDIVRQTLPICIKAVTVTPEALRYVSKRFVVNPQVYERPLTLNPELICDVKTQSEAMCLFAVKQDGLVIRFVLPKYQSQTVVDAAIAQNPEAARYIYHEMSKLAGTKK